MSNNLRTLFFANREKLLSTLDFFKLKYKINRRNYFFLTISNLGNDYHYISVDVIQEKQEAETYSILSHYCITLNIMFICPYLIYIMCYS